MDIINAIINDEKVPYNKEPPFSLPPMNLSYYSGTDNYSDGDVENRILKYICNNEPEQYSDIFKDDSEWAVFYHLTQFRKNLLNWYTFKEGSSLLEIGAGMGALTPLFCERCSHVTAVEMSKRRAEAIQIRCRNYKNLDIVVGDFSQMQFEKKFDYITVIGVLEYQSVYGKGDTPQLDFLNSLKKLLAPGGKLIVAIENKFGLKYWTGEGDDHSGIPFGSINDFAYGGNARTFDRQELSSLLTSAGFISQKFYYPLPDYKLPRLIYTDEYINVDILSEAFPLYYYRNKQGEIPIVIDENKIREPIVRNGVFPFFANSFLVECLFDNENFDDTVFASIQNGRRAEKFQIITRFDGKNFIKSAVSPEVIPHIQQCYDSIVELKNHGIPVVEHQYSQGIITSPLVRLELADQKFITLLKTHDIDGAEKLLDKLYNYILQSSEKVESEKNYILETDLIPDGETLDFGIILKSAYCDMSLFNCFYKDDDFLFFDQEWKFPNIPAGYVLFRALSVMYYRNPFLENLCPIKYWKTRYNLEAFWNIYDNLEKKLLGTVNNKELSVLWSLSYIPPEMVKNNISLLQTGHERLHQTQNELHQTQNELHQTQNELHQTQNELHQTQNERNALLNSRSWRITKPLRSFTTFIRRHMMLRLFVKGLLSIKRHGIKETLKKIITYRKRHLQVITSFCALKYESEYQENIDFSKYKPKVKAIAFYLPQFHAIPENDKWWGKGFTEWTNTRKAKPRFKGHYQPREPHKDIGYYNLTNVETLKKQAELAKQHGIYGFCFYFYWFSGKRLLEKPLDLLLEHPEIDINFCLCWANENWTRRWDGQDNEILMKQNYTDDDPFRFIEDIKKYVTDKRYIRIDGEPIILVYNPSKIPNVNNVFTMWREHAINSRIGKIKIFICRTYGHTAKGLNIIDNVDGEVEFPPNTNFNLKSINTNLSINNGSVLNYKEFLASYKQKKIIPTRLTTPPLFHTCMVAWDNTARKISGWTTFIGFSLKTFFEWVSLLVDDAFKTKDQMFFINAWNEWGEGTYLEPDKKYGYANINTFSKAIYGLPFYVSKPIFKWKYRKINNILLKKDNIKICIQIHLYDIELINEIIMNLNYIPFPFYCYISTDTDEKLNIIYKEFTNNCKNAKEIYVKRFDNRGRDVAPFIEQMEKEIDKFEFILHIHSKMSRTNDGYRDKWREYLFKHLLGDTENIYRIFEEFEKNKKLGLVFPESFPPIISWLIWGGDIEQGKYNVQKFLEKIGIEMFLGDKPEFAAGDMFWARTKAIRKAFCAGINQNDFPIESGQVDMTLAHAIERSWVYIAKHEGYTFKQINNKYFTDII